MEEEKGPWFLFDLDEACGLAFAAVYIPEQNEVQITLLLGFILIAAGWTF